MAIPPRSLHVSTVLVPPLLLIWRKVIQSPILTTIFLFNASPRVSSPRYQLTTLSYIYYGTNLGASYKPVSIACPCNTRWIFILLILTHPQLTLYLAVNTFLYNARLDPYIQKFISNTVYYYLSLHFHHICSTQETQAPWFTPPHRVGFRQPDCFGKFSHLLAELITRFSLLNSVLFDAGGAFQNLTSSFDSST